MRERGVFLFQKTNPPLRLRLTAPLTGGQRKFDERPRRDAADRRGARDAVQAPLRRIPREPRRHRIAAPARAHHPRGAPRTVARAAESLRPRQGDGDGRAPRAGGARLGGLRDVAPRPPRPPPPLGRPPLPPAPPPPRRPSPRRRGP